MMTFEQTIRQIVREENEKHLDDIKYLLESHGYQEPPKFLTIKETAKVLNIGITSTYELCHQSEHNGFPVIKEGKYRVPYNALMTWIDKQVSSANKAM